MSEKLVEAFFQAIELIITLDPEVLQITLLSLRVSLTAVLIAAIFGIPVGIFLGSKEFPGKRFILTLVNTGMSFPPVVMGLLVFLLFSKDGPFGQLGILLTDTAMILAQLLLAVPIITGLTTSAVGTLTLEFQETTTTLGVNQRQYLYLVIRETRIGLLAATIAAFGAAISEIGAIQIVGGNIRYKTRTLTTAIGKEISAGRWEFAMALGVILLTTAFLVNVLFTYLQHTRRIFIKGD